MMIKGGETNLKREQLIIFVVLLVLVGAGAFYGGLKYQSGKDATAASNRFDAGARNGQGGANRGANGAGRPVVGEITSVDDKSITVKGQDGSSKVVLLGGSVTVSKTDTASRDDLKTGVTVGVFGTTNADGSVSAQNIQLNPMFRFGNQSGQQSTQPAGR